MFDKLRLAGEQSNKFEKNFMKDMNKWLCMLFWVLLCALYSYWAWTPQLNDFGGDSAVYLLTAQHWSFFSNTNPAAAQFASTTIYPPVYPLLLALFSAGQSWLIAHQITAFCGVASLFMLWCCLRVEGLRTVDSLVAVLVLALIPGFYMQAQYIHSEFLFLLFVSICLYAGFRLEHEGKTVFVVVASLAAAGAFLTRTVGLSLVAALVVYVLLHRPRKEWAIVLVLAVAPVLAWMQFGQPPGGGYLAAWSERLGIVGSPSAALILKSQFAALVDGYQQNMVGSDSTNTTVVFLVALACFVAWLGRLWKGKLDALFLGAYFALLLVWPFPAERVRLFLPAVPIVVMQLLLALRVWKSPRGSTIAMRLVMVVLAIVILPSLVLTAKRHLEPLPGELEVFRHSPEWNGIGSREARLKAVVQSWRLQAGFEELQTQVRPQDCVYSIKPSLVGLFAQRNSYRSPLPNSSLGKTLDPKFVQCHFVHMLPFSSPTFSEPFYPLTRWADGLEVVHITRLVTSDESSPAVGVLGKIR